MKIGRVGGSRALIVADEGVIRAGLLDRVRDGLHGVEIAGIFTEVPANSSVAVVERGAAYARQRRADLLVAIGGGSPIDTAKAMRIILTEGGGLHDYEGYNLLERPLIPMVAIPTTAGTGSEVSPFAVIRDEEAHVKMTFSSPFLAPELAVLDPEMTRTLPPHLTAATGMDALTHAIQSFVSTEANPISESLALVAMDMIGTHLRTATYIGDDIEARGQMLVASCMAGMAFSSGLPRHRSRDGSRGRRRVRGASRHSQRDPAAPWDALQQRGRPESFLADRPRAGRATAGGRAEEHVIADGIEAVRSLAEDCRLPTRLRDVGVPEDALRLLAETALGDAAIFTNPRPASVDEVIELLRAAW